MQDKIRIKDLEESNIEDLIHVCSSKRLDDPIHQQGMKLKRQWLHVILKKYGSVAKIGYYDDEPVAQILYYPEEADVTNPAPRRNVLTLLCVCNSIVAAQRRGIGTKLLQSLVQDAKQRRTCLGNKPCKFIVTKAFNTGEALPLPEFYKKKGFLLTPDKDVLCLPIESGYEPIKPRGKYESSPEDKNKALIFYAPTCQFSFQFAARIAELIREVEPSAHVEMINQWERPEELIRRKNCGLIVNAKPIETFFMDTERFKAEVRIAFGKEP